jgi:hypothetical protein
MLKNRTSARTLVLTFLVAFGVRLAWLLLVQNPLHVIYSDMQMYVERAEELMWHLPTPEPRLLAIYPWGTHTLMALEFIVLGRHAELPIALFHAFLGAIPAPCMAVVTSRILRSDAAGAIVGLLVAFWYPQVAFAAFFMSEPWYSAAIALHAAATARRVRNPAALLATGVAAGVAFVVRPQFIVTWALDLLRTALARVRLTGLSRATASVVLLALPVALFVAGSALRLHSITGHWGLISENDQMTRIWADTDICKLSSTWTAPDGGRQSWWFSPPSKPAIKPSDTEDFEGFIADPDILKRIRLRRLTGVSWTTLARRRLHNVALLFTENLPWPESNYKDPPWRGAMQEAYADVLLGVVLPLAAVGIALGRRNAALFIAAANVITCVVCAYFFFGEGRYHVPYDPFFLVLAAVGVVEVHRRARAAWRRWRRRRGARAIAAAVAV